MKIAIIGAGFTGLSAGYFLQQKGHSVTIFEKEKDPGGLASGFKEKNWNYTLEKHYHHFFTNDRTIIDICNEINHKLIIKKLKTSVRIKDASYQLDSPLKVLSFPKLSLAERLRMGLVLSLLRYSPVWKPFEKIKTVNFLSRAMGRNAFEMIWKSQLLGKFGIFAKDISLAWFWARIKKRTSSLAYPEKGYLDLAKHLAVIIKKKGGTFYFDSEVTEILTKNKPQIKFKKTGDNKFSIFDFDAIIVTLPNFLFSKIAPSLPKNYKDKLKNFQGLGAINLVLRLKKPFLTDKTYWLSICDKNLPFLAIVEHTNFIDKKVYNNEHLVYIGKYLKTNDPLFKKSQKEIFDLYNPYLLQINKDYKKSLVGFKLSKDYFAQPVITLNYSKKIMPFKTPLKNVYLANMEQVYPWDRGTNYAALLGKQIAKLINENS